MEDQSKTKSLANLLISAKSVIVILPPEPSSDQVCAALSLHLAIKDSGRNSQIGCGSEVEVDPRLKGGGDITDTIGSRNLVISFDYHEDNLEKVDYDVRDDGKFYLLIKPKTGAPVPDATGVKFSYSGANSDLVIVLGIGTLEELGKIYAEEKAFLDSATIISLSNTARPAAFTNNQLQNLNASYSEIVTHLLESASLKPGLDAASNLLTGIYEETANLTSAKITADTFSSLAFLMRSGARLPNQHAFVPRFSQPPFFEAPHAPVAPMAPIINVNPAEDPRQVPLDWKQPKIYRASDT